MENQQDKASVVSRFSFGQEVWFLNGMHIMSGIVESVKGINSVNKLKCNRIDLEIRCSGGGESATFWIEDDRCYGDRQELVNAIVQPIRD